jgi:hypothetical protein
MEIAEQKPLARWFIDAWLPVDGMAFISLREAREDLWAAPNMDAGAVGAAGVALRLRAPEFEPEYIERGVAFGAVQRGAQEGLSFDGEGEFAFDSVEQIRAFVRRVYAGSGPGTTGGGGVPGPVPRNPDEGGPRKPWPEIHPDNERNAKDTEWRLPRYESIDRRDLERKLLAADPSIDAANLLIGSIDAAFDQWDSSLTKDCIMPQLQAALLLVPDAHQFWMEEFIPAIASERRRSADPLLKHDLVQIEAVVEYFIHYSPWRWPILRQAQICDLAAWRLPRSRAFDLGLPEHVDSWLDAICYVRADRSYLSELHIRVWGALLLALGAPLCIGSLEPWRVAPRFLKPTASSLMRQGMRMAAELVPAEALLPRLEDNIESWSRRRGPNLPAPEVPAPKRTLSS